jgi:site-specific recombinase XerD
MIINFSSVSLRMIVLRPTFKTGSFENFHFHMLRHTYTSNLLSNGANPKEVQELLGHSDVSTTMNIYAHSSQQAKHESAMLLDKIVS